MFPFSDDLKRRLKISSLPAQSRYAVGRILESDTLYYFLFHVGYKYPTYKLNGSFQTTSRPATDRPSETRLYLNKPQKVMPSRTNTPNTIAAA